MALHSPQLRSTFPEAFPPVPPAAPPAVKLLVLLLVVRAKNFLVDAFLLEESAAAAALGVDGERQLGEASAFIMGDALIFETFFDDLSSFCV